MGILILLTFVRFSLMMLICSADQEQKTITETFTPDEPKTEAYVSYWREDIGLNFFHWRWHSVFPAYWKPSTGEKRDRVGEIFPYMHEQILARYDAERLSSGLQRVEGFHIWNGSSFIPGYNSSGFTEGVSGRKYYSRPKEMTLKEMNPTNFRHMQQCYKKIVHDVRRGYLKMKNGTKIQLEEQTDIEVLGGVLLGSSLRHLFPRYCEFHGEGHFAFSHLHDIWDDDEDDTGAIAFPRASMRDPLFFAWHKLIEDIFWKFKKLLKPYSVQQVLWKSVFIANVSVQGTSSQTTNKLATFWQKRNLMLNRGLDFSLRHPIKVCLQHLQHEAFEYTLFIHSNVSVDVTGVVRVFLAPQNDEKGNPYDPAELSRLFMEMDKFIVHLSPGTNTLVRHSDNSTVANNIFARISELTLYDGSDASTEDDDLITYCSCAFPNHLLLPRGKPEGLDLLLFAMVTNAAEDMKESSYPECQVAPSYCGMLNDAYPDLKPMGYPFDRPIAGKDLKNFKTKNMAFTNVTVTFYNITL